MIPYDVNQEKDKDLFDEEQGKSTGEDSPAGTGGARTGRSDGDVPGGTGPFDSSGTTRM